MSPCIKGINHKKKIQIWDTWYWLQDPTHIEEVAAAPLPSLPKKVEQNHMAKDAQNKALTRVPK